MKLYRAQAKDDSGRIVRTYFRTSQAEAVRSVRDWERKRVVRASVPAVTQEIWINILETDSPGDQQIVSTPVDYLTLEEVVYSKNWNGLDGQ
jgi:hypothetical protein